MVRVVLTGSESTGKTTLAYQLGQNLDAIVVPEFVRDYAARKGTPLDFADHGPIARGQVELEDAHVARAAAEGKSLVIQDTDLLSTVVYCVHYFGRCPDWIRAAAAERRPDLYLLMEIDVPWIADDVRDRGGERRDEMQQLFRDAVTESGVPYEVIAGDWGERFERAMEAIGALLEGNL
jgi:NadR type nicotinamide-nucleotide adenylyltransferase